MSSANSERSWVSAVSTHYFWEEPFSLRHLDLFAEAGFEAVELFFTPSHLDHRETKAAGEIRRKAESSGLAIVSGHAPYMPGRASSIASLAQGERENALNEVFQAIAFLAEVGARYIVLHPGTSDYSLEKVKEHVKASADSIGKIVEFASRWDMKVALENPPPAEFAGTPKVFKELLKELKDLPLSLCFDTGHAVIVGLGLEEFDEMAPNGVMALHLSDNDGKEDLHLPPGKGVINWDDLFKAAEGLEGEGRLYFTLEIESRTCPPDCLRAVGRWMEEAIHGG